MRRGGSRPGKSLSGNDCEEQKRDPCSSFEDDTGTFVRTGATNRRMSPYRQRWVYKLA